uniref:Coagulation factor XIII A chain n=1 Tax=Hucho hucho TaxID=62062 RepID=A0A4W5KRQ4_9TELE
TRRRHSHQTPTTTRSLLKQKRVSGQVHLCPVWLLPGNLNITVLPVIFLFAATLKCMSVDMMQHKNKSDHHCHLYEGKNNILIVRRAQEFQMTLQFNQPINPSDKFQIEFYIGKTFLPISTHQQEDECVVGITPSANAIIGRYYTNAAVIGSNGISRTQKDYRMDFYLLFNTWASSELNLFVVVFLPRTNFTSGFSTRCWNIVAGTCFHSATRALVRSGTDVEVRALCRPMNSQDDRGVLVGNWSDDYSLGTAPTFWIGSDQILLQYANKGPVSYAQCWVCAGMFNTFLRCLGIPARVITNIISAHNNTGNIITDLVCIVSTGTTTAYLSRPDLPAVYDLDGWQVVDSTPQDTSDGYYRCGPCSGKAIKEGLLGYQFDAPITNWENRVTKHGRSDERTYKMHMRYNDEQEIPEANVEMMLEIPLEPVKHGKNFQMAVVFRILSEETRTIHGFLVGSTIYYTNIQRAQFMQEIFDVTLNPMESEVQVVVLAQNYMPQLGCQSNLRVVVTAKSMDNIQDMTAIQIVNLEGPELAFSVGLEVPLVVFKVEFTNPFPFRLHDVRMAMQGPHFMSYWEKLYSEIATGASITWMESCVPTRSVDTMIYAVLDCSVLGNVQGNWAICIQA